MSVVINKYYFIVGSGCFEKIILFIINLAPSEEALLERALAMSLEGQEDSLAMSPHTQSPDISHMTEEEQIAFAMQMSMQDTREYILCAKTTHLVFQSVYYLLF